MKATEQAAVADVFKKIKQGAASRYEEISREKPVIMVGAATCGRAAGAPEVLQAFRDEMPIRFNG